MKDESLIPTNGSSIGNRFKLGDDITDLNWAVLYMCIMNPNLSANDALISAGLIKEGNRSGKARKPTSKEV